jgi:hypothetical protein
MKQKLHSFFLFLLLFMVQNAWGLGGTLEGTNIKWSLSSTDDNQTYTLIIKGSGDMPDYEKASEAPWYGKRAKIVFS